MTNSRMSAYKILEGTLLKNQYTNLALKNLQTNSQDTRFITKLVYTSLQNYESLLFQSEEYIKKPVPKHVEILLVMGNCQHYKMDSVQEYAIVNEMVNLAKKVAPGYQGLINAVLKKTFTKPYRWCQTDDEIKNLSINTSTPQWITALLVSQYGQSLAEKLLAHNQTEAPLYLRVNQLKTTETEIVANYPALKIDNDLIAQPSFLKSDALSLGLVVAQDKTSQKICTLFDLNDKKRILYACSAPGTKTSQLATMAPQAEVIAVELHEHRANLVAELMKRLSITNVTTITNDICKTNFDQKFDAILCDVPCSGLGVLRRKPDLKYRMTSKDLDSLQVLQSEILNHVDKYLSVDGQLVYSTCTLNRKENEKQIANFLANHSNYKLISEETVMGVSENSDGFYMAKLIKVS